MTGPSWMVVRMKKSRTKKFTTTNHTPLPLQCKRSPISNLGKMILWDTRPPSSWSADLSKVAIPCPNNPSLIYLPVLTRSMSLDLLTYFKYKDIVQVHVAAAAAAKSPQLCPTLCDPIDGSPPGSTIPGILQARTLECVAISFSNA